MNNTVIKNLNMEYGKRIIKFFNDHGINTGKYIGDATEEDGDVLIYYGLIEGEFQNVSYDTLKNLAYGGLKIKIIKLPEETNPPYKGQLRGFPKEVVDKMLQRQVEQGNPKNLSVFENYNMADKSKGGFKWMHSLEGGGFWERVISDKDFDCFFKKYPKTEYPKVMWVSNVDPNCGKMIKGVVIKQMPCGKYLAWKGAETLEAAESATKTIIWDYAKEITQEQPILHLTFKDISDGRGVGYPPHLLRIKQ